MRFLLLSLLITIGLNAGEVTLSALIGKVNADKKLLLGEKLQTDTVFSVGPNSKIQLVINNTGIITISENSTFSIKIIRDDSVTLILEEGVYKIINLANQHQPPLSLLIKTTSLSMDMTNTIALINISSAKLKAICATSSFSIRHNGKIVTVKKNEMIAMQDNLLEKVPLNYDDFHLVLNKKHDIKLNKIHQESNTEDPTDLEN